MCLAVPGMIVRVEGRDPLTRTAKVSFGGIIKDVNLAFVPDAAPGEYVLVHVGFAIGRIDEVEATRIFETLEEVNGDPEARS